MKCRKCGSENMGVMPNKRNLSATDLYCKDCGAWQKFATKDEIRLYQGSSEIRVDQEKWKPCGFCGEPKLNWVPVKSCGNGVLGITADVGKCRDDETVGLVIYDKGLAAGYVDFDFCPFCGRPQTSDAWERLRMILSEVVV